MSKNSRVLPRKTVAEWLGIKDLDWEIWEEKIANETQVSCFPFSNEQKQEISDALRSLGRYSDQPVKLAQALQDLRTLRERIAGTGLPDHHLLNPDKPFEPSDFLMTLGFKPAADLFRQAMANTSVEEERGLSVEKRLGLYIALLRKNECCFEQPRDETIVICRIRDVFREVGATCFATHTWDSAYGKKESLSTFEQFIFEYVLVDYKPNAAGKQVLSRRLQEGDAAT